MAPVKLGWIKHSAFSSSLWSNMLHFQNCFCLCLHIHKKFPYPPSLSLSLQNSATYASHHPILTISRVLAATSPPWPRVACVRRWQLRHSRTVQLPTLQRRTKNLWPSVMPPRPRVTGQAPCTMDIRLGDDLLRPTIHPSLQSISYTDTAKETLGQLYGHWYLLELVPKIQFHVRLLLFHSHWLLKVRYWHITGEYTYSSWKKLIADNGKMMWKKHL